MKSNSLAGGFAVVLGIALVGVLTGLSAHRAESLPQYAAREARTCDNCHMDPSGWTDPELLDRQCSLSCSTCHVDPTGGGMRTAAGYYYGIQTLSAIGATRRPWGDDTWYFLGHDWEDVTPGDAELGESPTSGPTSQPSGDPTSQPTSAESQTSAAEDAPYQEPWLGNLAWGAPLNGSSQWAPEQGRYGSVLADPIFAIGADLRAAFFFHNGNGENPRFRTLIFPMQLDLSLMFHPIEHLTLLVEGGGQSSRGRLGLDDRVGADDDIEHFGLHEVFIMTHEWPANSYLKVGRFIPPFGTRLDDHTAFVRRDLGFDQGRPATYVSGVEIGGVANYPYLNAALFRTGADQFDFLPQDTGTGFSLVSGWRDLAWGAGASFYHASADQEDTVLRPPEHAGGERTMYGANWYFNPWQLVRNFPLTYLGEIDFVHLNPGANFRTVQQIAGFHEIDVALIAGMYLRMRYDFLDPDLDVDKDDQHRLSFQFDIFPIRFTELQFVGRILIPHAGDETDGDFLAITRFWY